MLQVHTGRADLDALLGHLSSAKPMDSVVLLCGSAALKASVQAAARRHCPRTSLIDLDRYVDPFF